jgi:hypothetical protein
MNFPGSGFITILIYANGGGSLVPATSILTEAGDPILWEDNNFALTE